MAEPNFAGHGNDLSERIRLVVVGLNFGAHMIEHAILTEPACRYVEIVGVCDFQEQKAREMAEKLQVAWYPSLDDVLADANVEAVALFSGPNGRARMIERIVTAGKHVMTTKPFDNDSAEAKRVLEKARELGKVVHLNSPTPELKGDLQQVQQWIRDYDLGRPIAFRAEVTCNYREKADGSWYDDPELCPAPPILRLGIYIINDLVRFFGDVERVDVQQTRIFTGRPTADNAQLGIQFKNGALGNIFASFCIDDQQYYKNAFAMNFERGTIYRNMSPKPEGWKITELQVVAVRDGKQIVDSKETEGSGGYQWDVFYKSVRGERTDDVSYAEDIVRGIRLIEMMKRQLAQS